MTNRFTHRFRMTIEIAIFLLVAFCTINWFRGDYFIKTLDSFFGFNHANLAYYASFLWKEDVAAFGASYPGQNQVFLHLFLSELMGTFGLILGQKIAFYLFVFFSMFSFWLFLYFAFSKEIRFSHVAARVFSSIFYSFNPFSMSFFWWHQMLFIVYWIAFPIIFLILYKIVTKPKVTLIDYFLLALAFLVFAPGLNLLTISILLLAFLIFLSLLIHFEKNQLRSIIKRLCICLLIVLLINLWYILPDLVTLRDQMTSVEYGEESPSISLMQFESSSRYTTLFNVFRLLGYHIIYRTQAGDPFYQWVPQFTNNCFMVILTVLFPILAISSILFIKDFESKERKILMIFGVLLIVAVFLQKQGSEPFTSVNYQLLKLPFGDALRNAYDKFAVITVFSYSVLLFFALRFFISRIKKKRYLVFSFLAIFTTLFAMYTYPFWTGDVIYDGGKTIPSHRVVIPEEYYQFGEFMNELNQNKTFVRIAALPTTWWGEAAYKWEKGVQPNSHSLLRYFLEPKYSIIQFRRANLYGNDIINMLEDDFKPYKENMNDFVKILADFGTEYIVFHKDWDDDFIEYLPKTDYYRSLINGYSYLSDLDGIDCWNFSKTPSSIDIKDVWQTPNPDEFDSEILLMANGFDRKQLTVSFGGFGVYLSEKNEIFLSFYTIEGYRWSSPIKVDFIKNSTIPLKIGVHYDAALDKIELTLNDVPYKVRLNPEDHVAPLDLKRNAIRIGTDDINQFTGCVFHVCLHSEQTNLEISPNSFPLTENTAVKNVDATRFRVSNIPLIEKIFENDKLIVFSIHNSTQMITAINGTHAQITDFLRVDPTLWRVYINASEPFTLSFAQSYDPLWKADVHQTGKPMLEVNSTPLHGVINGFRINQTGVLEITIEYEPQRWFLYGSTISVTTFLACLVYITYSYSRGNGFWKRVKHVFIRNKQRQEMKVTTEDNKS